MSITEWFGQENGKSIGQFTDEFKITDTSRELLCPQCGIVAEYVEEINGDDPFGQPEGVWYFECGQCGIQTDEKAF